MARRFGHLLGPCSTACGRIVENAKPLGVWKQLFQHFDLLRVQLSRKDADARHVASWPRQAGGEPRVHEIVTNTHDGKSPSRSLRGPPCPLSKCEDYGSAVADEGVGEPRKPVKLAFGEAHVETCILAVYEP